MHVCGVFSQPDDELVSLLQNLADMDVTYKALQVKRFFFLLLPLLFRHFCCLAYARVWLVAYLR